VINFAKFEIIGRIGEIDAAESHAYLDLCEHSQHFRHASSKHRPYAIAVERVDGGRSASRSRSVPRIAILHETRPGQVLTTDTPGF